MSQANCLKPNAIIIKLLAVNAAPHFLPEKLIHPGLIYTIIREQPVPGLFFNIPDIYIFDQFSYIQMCASSSI